MSLHNPFNKIKQPIFIVGCGRSGTTMLFDLLSQHPNLIRTTGYPDGEDHEGWIKHGQCVMAGIGNVSHDKYGSGINGEQYCLHMTEEHATDEVKNAMHGYYRRDVLGMSIGKRVINKQPHLSNKLRYLLGIFPDAKIIHIVRDCQPMVASWLAMMDSHPGLTIYWPKDEPYPCFWLLPKPSSPLAERVIAQHPCFFPGGGAALFADYWLKVNQGIPDQMLGREQQLITIKYEDLVADPRAVLSKLVQYSELEEHSFEVSHIETRTHTRYEHLIDEELTKEINTIANALRQSLGYA